MSWLKIPHNAFVFVCDGRKALFLRNEGDATFPNLKTEKVFQDENPDTHEQGSDRPGCLSKPSGQRSAVEPVDWHDLEEHRLARRVAAEMEQVVREHKAKALVVVAPPRTLADLRGAFRLWVCVEALLHSIEAIPFSSTRCGCARSQVPL